METVHTLNFNQFTTYSNYIYIYILYVYTHIELKMLAFYKSRGFELKKMGRVIGEREIALLITPHTSSASVAPQ